MKSLCEWIVQQRLDCELREGVIQFGKTTMLYVEPVDDKIIGLVDYNEDGDAKQDFGLLISTAVEHEAKALGASHYVFQFGEGFYYTPVSEVIGVKLTPFKYIGKAKHRLESEWPFLGVHGRYELMNGTRDYDEWCEKAIFYGTSVLGICEKHTLAGTLPFQKACLRNGIKPVIGGSYNVIDCGVPFTAKLYAKTPVGWRNLLRIHKATIIDNDGVGVQGKVLEEHSEGLICVVMPFKGSPDITLERISSIFHTPNLFFQIDTVEFEDNETDKAYLKSIKFYLEHFAHKIPPVLINDAYYLDLRDQPIKEVLNGAGNIRGEEIALNQYFKAFDDNATILTPLFPESGVLIGLLREAVKNARAIAECCDFTIDTKTMHLPKYKLGESLATKYEQTDEGLLKLFWDVIKSGYEDFERTQLPDKDYTTQHVRNRIAKESSVIVKGGYVSYFLILWDICAWCKRSGILTGIGRGSSGGSFIAYLMGITKINPLDYGLLFERFLNEGRMKGSFPDIDTDFEGSRRDEVKRYMEEKYGKTKVASIGTYTTLQTKNALKELARAHGSANAQKMNYLTSILDDHSSWRGLFKDALRKPALKEFIDKNPGVFEDIPLCLNSPKSQSVHPCATVIIPDETDEQGNELTIFDVLPMRKTDDGMLVTEWEGSAIESAGFLKEDILGIKQLDKLRMILDLVEKNEGVVLDLEKIPLDDEGTFKLFKNGYNADVFHFGSEGLSGYSYQVKPDSIIDLINMNALFRPGPMGSGSHNKYVKLKQGEQVPEYFFGTENETKETFGLMIFQEQIMLICQGLGGFTLAEADDVRKGMGKKKLDLLHSYKPKFVDSAVSKGGREAEAEEIWDTMVSFGQYGFNKSHAAAYSITGYACNYLKCHYPMEFWTTALHFAKDDKIPAFVSEIHKTGSIEVVPPSINDSELDFKSDYSAKKIYWAINKIKFVGDAAVSLILEERLDGGRFFSLDEFVERITARVAVKSIKPNPCNKRVLESLIIAGAFDEIENLQSPKERFLLMSRYWALAGTKTKDYPDWSASPSIDMNWFWTLMQRSLSGLGEMNFRIAIGKIKGKAHLANLYMAPPQLFQTHVVSKVVCVGGIVHAIKPANEARNAPALITLVNNDEMINIKVWCKHWTGQNSVESLQNLRTDVMQAKGKIMYFLGKISAPWGSEQNNTIQSMGAYKKETASEYLIL